MTKLSLENLNPVSITDHIDNFNIEDYANRLLKSENELSNISKNVNQDYFNSHLIWDILFINHREIIVARNNSTVEIWNIETGKSKHVKLPENGDCVELHINSSTNSLLVNLWNRNFQFNNTNKLFSIDLSDLKISEIISCSHTISKSKNNYFLARQTDHSDKSKKDFILNENYKVIFEKRLGHYDLFNHYLRIDNSELLYFFVGNPKEQHQNKILCSINPSTFEIKEVWQVEQLPNHYNDLNGIKISDNLIISGKVYSSNRNPYGTQELFCIDLTTNKEKWFRTISGQVTSFGILDNGASFVIAMTSGQIEIIQSASGQTKEILNQEHNKSFAKPLSLSTFDNRIAVGLTNGQILIYDR